MTEVANGIGQGSDTPVSQPVATSSSGSSYSPAQTEERLFKQSEINDIIKREKYGAVEDYRREQAKRSDQSSQRDTDYNSNQYQNQNRNLSDQDVRRMAAEESHRLRDEWIADTQRKSAEEGAQRLVNEFFTKLSAGKDKYQDFDKVVADVDYGSFPNSVQLLNNYIDNAPDVMYELGKDRSKLALLEQLSNMSPRDAVVQIQRLSQSIKDNEER